MAMMMGSLLSITGFIKRALRFHVCLAAIVVLVTKSPDVHMGMIVELPHNTLAVAFQESSIGEGCNDQSIFLTLSNDGGRTWSPHTIAAHADYACWGYPRRCCFPCLISHRPVLYFQEDSQELWMFYSVSSWQQNRTPTTCGSIGQSYPGGSINYIKSAGLSFELRSL